MSVFLQPIYTQTVGAGGASSITFNNIPQTFTDLKVVVSARVTNASNFYSPMFMTVNGLTSSTYSDTIIYASPGVNSSRNSYGATSNVLIGYVDGETATASTFSSNEIYIPNYTSSNYKQCIADSIMENNSTSIVDSFSAILLRTTNAISSLSVTAGVFAQYSTFSLYGVLRQGI
jgi:aspartate/tyrosine/aromatic aminotransferase